MASVASLLNGPPPSEQQQPQHQHQQPMQQHQPAHYGGSNRRSSRQITRPRKYDEDDDDFGGAASTSAGDFFHNPVAPDARYQTRGARAASDYFVNGAATPDEGAGADVDEEDEEGLMRATAHLWREPLEDYVLAQHAKRQRLEADWLHDEESRRFVTAARISDMASRRLSELRTRKKARLEQLRAEQRRREREAELALMRQQKNAEAEQRRVQEREERLARQREAARRKRQAERERRAREQEAKRHKEEEDRLALEREQVRLADLPPHERERIERQAQEHAQREKDEHEQRLRDIDAQVSAQQQQAQAQGSAAKRKRRETAFEGAEAEAAKALTGLGGAGAYDELDELDDDGGTGFDDADDHAGTSAPAETRPSRPGFYAYKSDGQLDDKGYEFPPPSSASPGPSLARSASRDAQLAVPQQRLRDDQSSDPYAYDMDEDDLGSALGVYDDGPDNLDGAQGDDDEYFVSKKSKRAARAAAARDGGAGAAAAGAAGSSEFASGSKAGSAGPSGGRDKSMIQSTKGGWNAVEDFERRIWVQIAKRDIPKVHKFIAQSTTTRNFFSKRISTIVAREARRTATRTKGLKDIQLKAKRLARESLTFMKGNEKRERESRKKAEKEALERAKKEEDMREAKRQARKLNFLITQTELYSHFVGSKIKTSEAEESADTAGAAAPAASAPGPSASLQAAIAAGASDAELRDLDFDDDDETNAHLHARKNAQAAVEAARQRAAAFDAAAAAENKLVAEVGDAPQEGSGINLDGDELNFQNPTSLGEVTVKQPTLLTCTLKEYQLKGLNWLANLYEQGINGILADEMGLGKTVQSIALMAYLAEVHNIWGPFLVIAPASTLHNWQQEITKFVPALKALPYWGNQKDRTVLRKFWNRKSLRYDKDAPFHILVTSYQLVVQDEKYFQRVKWQYMVLDEAQAIKSSSSARWKTLLGFHCRNRLLLTGTPIQNSMHELWALLHFIMPSLFDSHEEFNEWFSKDIEGNAENKAAMNEHQLRRLHMILKPFMLRRIKKNVQNELTDKIEIDVPCELTPRQKFMYRTLRQNISIADLVARATSLNDDDSVKRLMNLIMQFRKVCNHPELFERADVKAPFSFSTFNSTANLIRDPPVLEVSYATSSIIECVVPRLVYRESPRVAGERNRYGFDTLYLDRLMNIWSPDHVNAGMKDGSFAFARSFDLSPSEVGSVARATGLERAGFTHERLATIKAKQDYNSLEEGGETRFTLDVLPREVRLPFDHSWRSLGLTPLHEIEENYRRESRLTRPDTRFAMDPAVAPAINAVCHDHGFVVDQARERFPPKISDMVYGVPSSMEDDERAVESFEKRYPGVPPSGILGSSTLDQLPFPPMQVPQLEKLILDSGKLAKLDKLLTELKAGGHRCLVYFQMTKMIDLMEEYLTFRQYKYLRLDGSSTISERRDMVSDWQTKPEIFIFLLSTRAGGLGINLTAADTVIFYDSDWNPSNDLQAMDRAHRLGQTKQVTIYRLITTGTVDERIVNLARTKKQVQDAVVGSSAQSYENVAKPNEVVSLLLGDDELEEGMRAADEKRRRAEEDKAADGRHGARGREEKKAVPALGGPSWQDDDEEGMSFFAAAPKPQGDGDDDLTGGGSATGASTPTGTSGTATPAAPGAKKPRKRKAPANGEGEGAAPPKRQRKKKTTMADGMPVASAVPL